MTLQVVAGREVEMTVFSQSRDLNSPSGGFARSWAIAAPVVDLTFAHSFSELLSGRAKASIGYRFEYSDLSIGHSPIVATHFAIVSVASDSNLYFPGF